MKSLSIAIDRQEILARVSNLSPTDTAKWGKMSVHQMVCHLNDSYLLPLGDRTASSASGAFQRTIMKFAALRMPFQWPKGVPTRPEMEQGRGGTPPLEFNRDRAALIAVVDRFCDHLPEPIPHHPIFGPMPATDWMRWGYLHADHHLRQFGR